MVSASLPTSSSADRVQLLRKCQSQAEQLKQILETSQFSLSPASNYRGPIPDLNLPFPDDILLLIHDMGLPKHISQQLKSKVTEKIIQFRKMSISIYQQMCHDLPAALISYDHLSRLANTFETFYIDQQISGIRAKILTSKASLHMINNRRAQEAKKPAFNFEYTPMLEKYFEHNAYPSRPDRLLLARKSSMSERQIEVWFQNHRNRSKKEGIPLKRANPHQLLASDLVEQKKNVSHPSHPIASNRVPSPSNNDINTLDVHNVPANSQPCNEAFRDTNPPLHVFPTPYRRGLHAVPFQEVTFRFPPPDWHRKPAMQTPPPLSVNMEEFIEMFASKLNIRRLGMKTQRITSGSTPWFYSTVTIPSPAPHPALIRTNDIPRPSTSTPLLRTAVPNPMTPTNTFHSSHSPLSKSSGNSSKPRKAPPFTFRTPQKPLPLPFVNTSSSAFETPGSRISSFASVSSIQSRSSSVSTGSSPGPTTPPHSPINDAHIIQESFIQESTSDTYIDDLFAGVPPDAPQSFDDFLSNINNEDIFSDKHIPTSTHNFPYLDSLCASA